MEWMSRASLVQRVTLSEVKWLDPDPWFVIKATKNERKRGKKNKRKIPGQQREGKVKKDGEIRLLKEWPPIAKTRQVPYEDRFTSDWLDSHWLKGETVKDVWVRCGQTDLEEWAAICIGWRVRKGGGEGEGWSYGPEWSNGYNEG